jgi:hypothetical protein
VFYNICYMPIPWSEIRVRAAKFAEEWKDAKSEQADKQTFWNEFFEIFGTERKSVALYEKAVERLGKANGFIDLFWPGVVIVEHKSLGKSLDAAYDQAADYALMISPGEQPRYLITSDFQTFRLYDLAATDGPTFWQIDLKDLPKKADMFSFIGGYKKQEIIEEDPVNRKAAERLAELHDQLKATRYTGHDLEVLLVRLLFCLFAEDSGIFEKGLFYEFVYNETDIYGSDLGVHLMQLFEVLNTPKDKRQSTLDETLAKFPYVNGKLFSERIAVPTFDYKMRDSLLNASHTLNWSTISPAIFGAMFQGVMDPQERRSLGAHYTSEQNIMKVIKPLFLDELWGEFERAKENRSQLNAFHDKLSKLTFFDPACGCGNFLVVSYRELRRLELETLKIIYALPGLTMREFELDLTELTKCNVDQFYGIEIEEFPAQIAQVALWLTDVQMNNEAADHFGKPLIRLPLTHSATIIKDDALDTNWHDLIEPSKLDYLFGNPPFSGSRAMDTKQKELLRHVAHDIREAGFLDFVSGWYFKAIDYIQGTDIKVAFVSTNSICQGEQVGILWSYLLDHGAHINFAHRTFRWSNDAKGNAAVYCVIIGFWLKDSAEKWLFEYPEIGGDPHATQVKYINPYLIEGPNVIIRNRQHPIADVPEMSFGNMPRDGGNFILSLEDKEQLVKQYPHLEKYIRPFVGAQEFLHNEKRYCLWLVGAEPSEISKAKPVLARIEKVKQFRLASKAEATRNMAKTPTLFAQRTQPNSDYILVPGVSSENRNYIPMGYLDKNTIASNAALVVPNASLYHFGLLESKMHMTWMRYVAGRLKSDYRYSKDIVYNNFPWPSANEAQQKIIAEISKKVLTVRAKYPESNLAELYSPLTMPIDLLKTHEALDSAVDTLYRKEKFESDTVRMQYLLELYQKYSVTT